MKKYIIILPLLFLLTGCAASTRLHLEKGVSFRPYKAIEVNTVINETGETFDFDVTGMLTERIKSRLKDRGYRVVDETCTDKNVLVVKSTLGWYDPGNSLKRWAGSLLAAGSGSGPHAHDPVSLLGSLGGRGNYLDWGEASCRMKSALIDKSTGRELGYVVASKSSSVSGWYAWSADKFVLKMVADGIADEIADRLKYGW